MFLASFFCWRRAIWSAPAKGNEEVLSNLAHDRGRENGPPKGMWACVDLVWATERRGPNVGCWRQNRN